MRVLKAPDTYTRDRITSEGEVHFENGIATEFTREQAALFCENLPGYEVVEIAGEEAPPKAAPVEEVPVVEPAPEEGDVEEAPVAKEKEAPEEVHETIFDKALDRIPKKAKNRIIRDFGKHPSISDLAALILAEKAGRNRETIIAWLEGFLPTEPEEETEESKQVDAGEPGEQLETGSEPTPEDEPGEPETGAEVEEELPETGPGEPGELPETGSEVEEEPPEEETKPMEEGGDGPPEPGIADDDRPPDGQDDVLPESTDEESGGQGSAGPADEDTGAQGKQPQIEGKESAVKEIVLPVIQDDIKVVRAFAIKYGISADGGKGIILERIYADQRFKK